MNKKQLEVLNGCLLGDGSIIMHKDATNAYFQYLSSSKEHVEYMHKYFKGFCTEGFQQVKCRTYFDKRTEKTYTHYYFRTRSLPIFTTHWKKWYPEKKKIVPVDIKITPVLLLCWYLGDGELASNRGYIKLHTNSFSKEEVLSLCGRVGFSAKPLRKKEGVLLVTIPRKEVKSFLKTIGDCPVLDYKHKWEEVPYVNKNIEVNGIKSYSHLYNKIIEDWNTGQYSVYKLSLKYSIPHKCIYNYFEKNDIERVNVENKKSIIQYDLAGNYIKEWESGQEIKKILGYNASAVSECCRGIRKKYKKYIWKFKKQ